MNRYNPNIHHRRSIRLKGYDYTQAGLYFITICCQDRTCRFGTVENGEMILNEYGHIAHNVWVKTPEIRPNVELGEFIVMPNHMHGIIRLLGRGELLSPDEIIELHSPHEMGVSDTPKPSDNGGEIQPPDNGGEIQPSDNGGEIQPPDNGGVFKTPLRSPSQTVGAVVRGYKSSVTKQLGLMGFTEKLWQRNYYEHIIRDEQSYHTITAYIINNPAKWQDDKFYVS